MGLLTRWQCRVCTTAYAVWSLARECELACGYDGDDAEGWS